MENTALNIRDMVKYLNVSESTVRRMVRNKTIPFYRVGVQIFFRKSVVDEWIKAQEQQAI